MHSSKTPLREVTWAETAWSKAGLQNFTGSNSFGALDTGGINLFSEENLSKDFEISFDIINNSSTDNFSTLVSNMDESGDPYPFKNFWWSLVGEVRTIIQADILDSLMRKEASMA
jgi:hypothetical protein